MRNTLQAFKPSRLVLGLLVVSIVCGAMALVAWPRRGPMPYVFLLVLPALGYACVLYWGGLFSGWSVPQRLLVVVLFAPLLGLGFMFVVICLRFTFYVEPAHAANPINILLPTERNLGSVAGAQR